LISAGKYKVEGNPYAPLDEEAQGFMQSRVDDYYASFTKAVARGRGVPIAQVRDGDGPGACARRPRRRRRKAWSMAWPAFDEVVRKMRRDARSSREGEGKSSGVRATGNPNSVIMGSCDGYHVALLSAKRDDVNPEDGLSQFGQERTFKPIRGAGPLLGHYGPSPVTPAMRQ
jgi:hypothetical protein